IAMNITNTNTHNGSANTMAELFFDRTAEKENWRRDVINRYPKSTILTLKDGIKHIRMTKYINGRPIRINVVEVNPKINEKISVKPVMAADVLNRRSSIKSMAQKGNAIAAINGSYFKPQTGVPLGTMMVDGQMLTGPVYNRVALGIKGNEFLMARLSFNGKLIAKHNELKLDNINQPRMLSTYVITYNKKWGKVAPPPPKYGAEIAIENGKVINFGEHALPIPENGYVIVGPKVKLEPFVYEKNLRLEIKAGDKNWADVEHIISGGPYLVKENKVYVDITEEKLKSVGGRNPRTAIGYTSDGKFIMVTVDGREETSVGMTLTELAYFMKSIGCYNAMNLDGGGSSVMYFNGFTVNRPSVKGGIPLSNALVIYEEQYPEEYAKADITGS
ncbi:MAG: phosphodiester glycosidase family protein, partial [Candidatus Gastranaerophilales bacterium]|nr:phosphodiester glycosidase family protein [Candidatus Gastranaerophilales bacterium]